MKSAYEVYEPSSPSGQRLSRFLELKVTRRISNPPWMGCLSITGGQEVQCESKVSCPKTHHNAPLPAPTFSVFRLQKLKHYGIMPGRRGAGRGGGREGIAVEA